jgi:hypothetical protein
MPTSHKGLLSVMVVTIVAVIELSMVITRVTVASYLEHSFTGYSVLHSGIYLVGSMEATSLEHPDAHWLTPKEV